MLLSFIIFISRWEQFHIHDMTAEWSKANMLWIEFMIYSVN